MTANNLINKVKVLIIDGSASYRSILSDGLRKMPNVDVVGTAADPYEGRDKILSLRPDVITLEVDMPRMNGIHFLKRLIPQYPIPCVMVSAHPNASDALAAGAVDHIEKPPENSSPETMQSFFLRLNTKLTIAASAEIRIDSYGIPHVTHHIRDHKGTQQPAHPVHPADHQRTDNSSAAVQQEQGFHFVPPVIRQSRRIIALGASTGGTDALEVVLMGIPGDCPPIVVVQHMPPKFTKIFAERLDRSCKMEVREAVNNDRLRRGLCLIAPGDLHMKVRSDNKGYFVTCENGERVSGHRPSVDVLFSSTAEAAGSSAVAAILTGMGADGARGMKLLRDNGAYTIGQDEKTCVVYGMPMVAYKMGGVCEQAPLKEISAAIMRKC